jgi:hypothetical protein
MDRKHVYRDLRPYVCVSKECETAGCLYGRRRAWIAHERKVHAQESSGPHYCVLCSLASATRDGQLEHIAQHLEELALFALPPSLGKWSKIDNDMVEDGTNEEGTHEDGTHSKAVHFDEDLE